MALINKAVNEITVKLVYYGPGLCGKTTNLEKIYSDPKLGGKGKMLSVATETDRTLFFDFMPMEIGTIRGQKVRVQLYTVPGQVFYDATRRLVLRGADGVVFVADSQRLMADNNLESFRNLRDNLVINRIDPDKIPIVLQYNKRDLKDVMSVDELDELMNPDKRSPTFEAVALAGKGVRETMQKGVALILSSLAKGVDLSLADEAAVRPAPRASAVISPPEPPPPPPPAPPLPPDSAASLFAPSSGFGEAPMPDLHAPSSRREVVAPAVAAAATAMKEDPGDVTFVGDEDPFAEEPAPAPAPVAAPKPAAPPAPAAAPVAAPVKAPSTPAPAPVTTAPVAPASEAISIEMLRALYRGTEQSLALLRSIAQDLEQQQAVLKRFLGEG